MDAPIISEEDAKKIMKKISTWTKMRLSGLTKPQKNLEKTINKLKQDSIVIVFKTKELYESERDF